MDFNKQLFEEINSVRLNPSSYVDKVLKYKDYFEGNILKIPGIDAGIQTQEGAAAYEEAANFLKSAQSTEALTASKGLFQIANDYLSQIQNIEVEKIDTIDINTIIDKYGSYQGEFAQSMEYGSITPEQIVISLLVSDGDSTRAYRDILLKSSLKKIGIATGKHNVYQNVAVLLYCIEYKNNDDSSDVETFTDNKSTTDNSNAQPLTTLSEMISPEYQKQKEEEERKQKEKEEAERLQREKEEAERLQKEKEEAERLQKEKEEAERLQKEIEEAERLQRENEEAERLQRENEEAERLQRENEEAERLQRENEEAERLQKEKEEKERKEKELKIAKEKKEEIEKIKKAEKEQVYKPKEEDVIKSLLLIYLIIMILFNF